MCQYLYAAPAEGIILLKNKYITPYFLSHKPCEAKKNNLEQFQVRDKVK